MVGSIRCACLRVAPLAGFVAVTILSLLWSTAAYAQSREDQYGSPTGPVDHVGRVLDTLGVLPETGGPLILFVGTALVVVGTGMALVSRRNGRR